MAENNDAAQPAQTEGKKVKLTVSGIQEDLKNNLDRKAIKAKYGLSQASMTELFKHPKLKGLRVRATPNFELIDDTKESASGTVATDTQLVQGQEGASQDAPVATEVQVTEPATELIPDGGTLEGQANTEVAAIPAPQAEAEPVVASRGNW